MGWKFSERPGYLGKQRDRVEAIWNEKFGKDNWRIMYQVGKLIVPRSEGIQLFEDAYYHDLLANPDKLDFLITGYSDVYDTAESNIKSEFDYSIQETSNNHIHDIALRRALFRTGNWFAGKELLNVRSTDSEGWIFSPCNIPFHLPHLICTESINDYGNKGPWWDRKGIPNSTESFYQKNKVLQVKLED
jgi:hypothetical protein